MILKSIIYTAFSLIAILAYLQVAKYYTIIDRPNERSSHTSPVVRGLGIVFPLLFAVGFWLFDLQNYLLLAGLCVASIVGFLDDLYSLRRSVRLLSYLLATVLCVLSLEINFDWSDSFIIVVIGVLFVGTVNAYNFMDGINGITILYSLVLVVSVIMLKFIGLLDFLSFNFFYVVITILVCSAYFNVRKEALAFLGDAGSIFLGFLVCFLVLSLSISTRDVSWIVLLAVYGVDSVGTIIFRLLRKENIFDAHRLHIYQKLANEKKHGHLSVSLGYAMVQGVINGGLLLLLYQGKNVIGYVCGVFLFCMVLYFLLRKYYIKDLNF